MIDFWHDLKYGARSLSRNPGVTVLALLTLALGLGTNIAIFSLVNGVLLRPLPLPSPEQLVVLLESAPALGMEEMGGSSLNFLDWQRQNHVFESLSAFRPLGFSLSGRGAEPEAVAGAAVTGDFFRTVKAPPWSGRLLGPNDDRPGAEKVVVLGADLWHRRFGADPTVVNRPITIDGVAHVVVGILPAGLDYPYKSQLWVPLALDYGKERRGAHYLGVLGRLRPGISVSQAQAAMSTVAAQLAKAYPADDKEWGVDVRGLRDLLVEDARPALKVLQAAVWALLLLACANVAGLLLARLSARRRELTVRAALGAGRLRLVRQIVVEGVMLSVAAVPLGLLVAWSGVRALIALDPGAVPRADEVGLDVWVFGYAVALAIATGTLSGLIPAFALQRDRLYDSLRQRSSSAPSGRSGVRSRAALILTEIALATSLLVGAGLLIESLMRLAHVNPGFNPRGVATARLRLPASRYSSSESQGQLFQRAVERIRALPGVEHAATAEYLPLQGYEFARIQTEDHAAHASGQEVTAHGISTSPDYFATMGIPLLRGRRFTDRDNRAGVPVVMISRLAAARLWPGKNPLGKRLSLGAVPSRPDAPWWEVVGVVGDVRDTELAGEADIEIYTPQLQLPSLKATFVVRAAGDPLRFVKPMSRALQEIDPNLTFDRTASFDSIVAGTLAGNRVKTSVLGVFAVLALALAAVGVYGSVSVMVGQRVHEIGVRMALGASNRGVVWFMVREGMGLVALGLAVGMGLAYALCRLLASQLYHVGVLEPAIWGTALATLGAVSFLANWLPARRCAAVDPLVALRHE